MLTIQTGSVIPTSAARRFGFTRVIETMLVLGDERKGLVPVKVTKGKTTGFTLIRRQDLDKYLATSLVRKKGISEASDMTPFDQNICGLWLHMKNLTKIPAKDPGWSWTGVKEFCVEFNSEGYIKAYIRADEISHDVPYALLAIQRNGILSLRDGMNIPGDFPEQLKKLNELLAGINT